MTKVFLRVTALSLALAYGGLASAMECATKNQVGSATTLRLAEEPSLKSLLPQLGSYREVVVKECDVEEQRGVIGGMRARFSSAELFITLDSLDSKISTIFVNPKMEANLGVYTEIELYARSETQQQYFRLLHAIVDGGQRWPALSVRFNHADFLNQPRYILISWRSLSGKDPKDIVENRRNILLLKYKDRGIAIN